MRSLIGLLLLLGACASTNVSQHDVSIELVWRTAFGLGDYHRPSLTEPIVDERRVYVASAIGYVYALDAKTGDRIWSVFLSGAGLTGQMVLDAQTLYVPSAGGKLWRIDANTGMVQKQYDIPATTAKPLVAQDMIIVQTHSGSIIALHAETGEQRWVFTHVNNALTSLATGAMYALGNMLLVGDDDGVLLLLDMRSGQKLNWSHRLATSDADHVLARIVSVTGIVPADDLLITTARHGGIAAFRARTLQLAWHAPQQDSMFPPFVAGDKQAIAVRTNASLYAFSPITGDVLWQKSFAKRAQSLTRAVVLGQLVVVGTDSGEICALSLATGEQHMCKRLTPDAIGTFNAVDVDRGMLYMTDTQGFVFAVRFTQM